MIRILLFVDFPKRRFCPFEGEYTGSSRLHTFGSSRPSYLRFIQTIISPVHLEFSYLQFIQISFIPLVHLDFFHTSGSSRTSYLRFIQSFHTSGSSRLYSYLWFIQIFFIHLVHLEFSYLRFIQILFSLRTRLWNNLIHNLT